MSFIAIGILFLSKCILDLLAGAPPSSGVEILAWRAAQEPTLAITNEVLFSAAGLLIMAVIGFAGVSPASMEPRQPSAAA